MLALSAVLAGGCEKKVRSGTVKGTVSMRKGPAPFGFVVFFSEANTIIGKAPIGPDGAYSTEVLTGPAKVGVYLVGPPPGAEPDWATIQQKMAKSEVQLTPEQMKELMEKMGKMKKGKGGGPPPVGGQKGMEGMSPEMMAMMAKMKAGKEGPGPMLAPGTVPGGMTKAYMRMPADMRDELRKLDEKYGDPDKSGLTLDIRAEEQTFDIQLRLN
jgi:hypothetical protein